MEGSGFGGLGSLIVILHYSNEPELYYNAYKRNITKYAHRINLRLVNQSIIVTDATHKQLTVHACTRYKIISQYVG